MQEKKIAEYKKNYEGKKKIPNRIQKAFVKLTFGRNNESLMHCLENRKQIESFFMRLMLPERSFNYNWKQLRTGEKVNLSQWFDIAWVCAHTLVCVA